MSQPLHSLNRALLSGSAWALLGKLTAVLAGLATNAILARIMSPDAFGVYLLIASLATTVVVVTTLGTNSALVRILGREAADTSEIDVLAVSRKCLLIGACGSLAAGALLVSPLGTSLAASVFDSDLLAAAMVAMTIWILALTGQTIMADAHRGLRDIRLASLTAGPFYAVALLLLVGGAAMLGRTPTPQTVVWLCALSSLFAFGLGAAYLASNTSSGRVSPSYGSILQVSMPMMVINLAAVLLNQVDIWIVGAFMADQQLALYGSALTMASLISFPLLILNSAAAPYLTNADHSAVESTVRSATTYAAALSLAGLIVVLFAAPTVLAIVFGDFYREAGTVLMVLAAGRFVNVATGPCGLLLMMAGFHRLLMWVNIAIVTIAVLLMALVAKRFGMVGVAAVAALAMLGQNAVLLIVAHRKTGVWTHAHLIPRNM